MNGNICICLTQSYMFDTKLDSECASVLQQLLLSSGSTLLLHSSTTVQACEQRPACDSGGYNISFKD
jgi:hypothetical protein